MDTIEFRVVPTPHDYGAGDIEIRINGESLAGLVREVEVPFARVEGHPQIAGAYAGLPAWRLLTTLLPLLGEAESGQWDGKVALLACGDCGEIGCWPLLARVTVEPSRVVWSGFEQPYRSWSPAWCYDSFGPFVFDWGQYEAALKALDRRGE